ncbi:11708_t:CDS:2 [Acaulospora morrowiae]|uniref:11708_t:CDS:1 n=1 Tax=Acaulospora morrowiae TaxID=94023 RepID=A0A9N8YUQ8_9GLOM|nr:11708_t:CDS:2 [Acaulospora morrowiae]
MLIKKVDSISDKEIEAVSLHEQQRFEEAFPLFLHIAQEGNPLASYYAGLYLYEGNYGIERDEIQALQFLQKSAVGGNVRGRYMYANACLYGTYHSRKEGLKYLIKSANKNDPDALYMLSQIYKNGEHGYEIEYDKYEEYLKKAADNGSTKAQREIAIKKRKTPSGGVYKE